MEVIRFLPTSMIAMIVGLSNLRVNQESLAVNSR